MSTGAFIVSGHAIPLEIGNGRLQKCVDDAYCALHCRRAADVGGAGAVVAASSNRRNDNPSSAGVRRSVGRREGKLSHNAARGNFGARDRRRAIPGNNDMIRRVTRIALIALLALAGAAHAQKLTKLVFSTDWLAQAEHGGFYQAQAEGIYRKYGLDVEIRMGGPQVNGLQLLAAGRIDIAMADALQVLSAVEQNVPLVAIAATFQKNPTVLIAHPGVARIEDLKGKPVAIGSASNTTFWPWLREHYGFTDDQKRPYGFSVQPFLADPTLSQQGFATSEPFSIEQGGVKPVVFLLADLGYPPYSETLAVTRKTLAAKRDALERFIRASAEGWKSYLVNPAPGDALIKRANPQMSDALLAYGVAKLKQYRIVEGGDAGTAGLLTMTAARWKATIDFLRKAKLTKPGVDYARAYTLDLVKSIHVLP